MQNTLGTTSYVSAIRSTQTGFGCISDISSEAIHGCEHDYAAAMKSFGTVYEQYQSYLLPNGQVMAHDYDLAAKAAAELSGKGFLDESLLQSMAHDDAISDDDIEDCGYMGWLQH